MKKFSVFLSAFAVLLVISLDSCKRGNSVLVVADESNDSLIPQDTYFFPTAEYFFYGKFDGDYLTWQNAKRSKWDTITRFPADPNLEYTDNIYYNFTELENVGNCGPDSTDAFVQHYSYFIRPGNPYERLEIYFYDCIDLTDTTNAEWPFNQMSAFRRGANPFTSPEYGRAGVKVKYIDENLQTWETKDGSGQLDETYFRVYDIIANDTMADPLDTFALFEISGEFAGKLYNGTEEKRVIDARFNVRIVPREAFTP